MFNNKAWRALLNESCNRVNLPGADLQVISPFGFEVTQDKKYLSCHLRKFYAYIRAPQMLSHQVDSIAEDFSSALLSELLKKDKNLAKSFVVLIKNQKINKLTPDHYVCKADDKLLDVQVRITDQNILVDYAESIICNLYGLLMQKGQCSNFYTHFLSRSRIIQLYVMCEYLFSDFIPELTQEEKRLYHWILHDVNNMVMAFFDSNLMKKSASEQEVAIYENLIMSRVRLMVQAISQGNSLKHLACLDYHVPVLLKIDIDQSIYQIVLSKIIKTYRDFV